MRRQQQLLQGLQTSSESNGSSVFISPAFTLEVSGLPPVHITTQGAEGASPEGTAANTGPLPPQPAPSAPPAAPGNPHPGAGYYPPPYSAVPPLAQSLPPRSGVEAQPLPPKLDVSLPPQQLNGGPHFRESSPPFSPQNPPAKPPRQPKNNKIILKDGTTITIKSKDEYLFVGPKGHQMVVNCLPLFTPRPSQQGAVDSATGGSESTPKMVEAEEKQGSMHESMHEPRKQECRQTKAMRRFVLKKASSADNLLNTASAASKIPSYNQKKQYSEAEDLLDGNMRSSIKVQRSMWTHFDSTRPASKSCSELDDKAVPPDSIMVTISTEPTKKGNDDAKKEEEVVGGREGSDHVDAGDREKEDGGKAQSLSDGGSDGGESKEMRVSYIDDPEQVQTLKRSSGSVSFIGRTSPFLASSGSFPPPSVAEDVAERSEEEGEREGEVDGGTVADSPTGCEGKGESGGGEEVAVEGKDGTDREGTVSSSEAGAADDETKIKGDDPNLKQYADKGPEPRKADVSEKAELVQATPATPSAPPQVSPDLVPLTSAPTVQNSQQLTFTPLPPVPMIFEPEFIERSGWLMKLSHRRGK